MICDFDEPKEYQMAEQLHPPRSKNSKKVCLHCSIRSYSPIISEKGYPQLESSRKGLFGTLSILSLTNYLTIPLAQYNAIIAQLEELVLIQQNLLLIREPITYKEELKS